MKSFIICVPHKKLSILSRVGVTYKTGFWIGYIAPYIFRNRDYRRYSTIADLHTLQFIVTHALGFSVFTSRILATNLSQSHCNFSSHTKSSRHSLIPFLPFLFNDLRLPFPELDPLLFRLLFCTPFSLLTLLSYDSSARTPRKTPSSFVENACSLDRYLAMDVLLLSAYASCECVYQPVA
jgi:hypothetical protein